MIDALYVSKKTASVAFARHRHRPKSSAVHVHRCVAIRKDKLSNARREQKRGRQMVRWLPMTSHPASINSHKVIDQ